MLASVRTNGPALPSGRRAASTAHNDPALVLSAQARVAAAASRVPMSTASPGVQTGWPEESSAGSATYRTSTSEM